MGFPLSQNITIFISESFDFDKNITVSKIIQILKARKLSDIKITESLITFYSNHSLFNFKYFVSLSIITSDVVHLKVEYDLNVLLKIILVIIIATAFFSRYSVSGYLIFCVIFSLLFYFFNVLFINSYLKNLLHDAVSYTDDITTELQLMNLQQEWLKSTDHCPGCGAFVTLEDYQCPECGLHLEDKKRPAVTMTTRYKNKRFTYKYIGKPKLLAIKYLKVGSKQ